jgi:hypothetical protein
MMMRFLTLSGNHDITLDEAFYAEHGHDFHNQTPQSHADCLALFTSSPSITYLNHSSATIRLSSPSGPHTSFSIFGSPYSPRCGNWAFSYDVPPSPNSDLPKLWDDIPLSTDILVTHTPPYSHLDETPTHGAAGCEALRRALWRVRPRLAVCGHVHMARGAERITWDLTSPFSEAHSTAWEDPGIRSNKLSLVDLTGRKAPPLANDGSHPQACASAHGEDRCDVDARRGRRETCLANASIVQTSYPHVGGKKLGKPIVVDLDLPVWEAG